MRKSEKLAMAKEIRERLRANGRQTDGVMWYGLNGIYFAENMPDRRGNPAWYVREIDPDSGKVYPGDFRQYATLERAREGALKRAVTRSEAWNFGGVGFRVSAGLQYGRYTLTVEWQGKNLPMTAELRAMALGALETREGEGLHDWIEECYTTSEEGSWESGPSVPEGIS